MIFPGDNRRLNSVGANFMNEHSNFYLNNFLSIEFRLSWRGTGEIRSVSIIVDSKRGSLGISARQWGASNRWRPRPNSKYNKRVASSNVRILSRNTVDTSSNSSFVEFPSSAPLYTYGSESYDWGSSPGFALASPAEYQPSRKCEGCGVKSSLVRTSSLRQQRRHRRGERHSYYTKAFTHCWECCRRQVLVDVRSFALPPATRDSSPKNSWIHPIPKIIFLVS